MLFPKGLVPTLARLASRNRSTLTLAQAMAPPVRPAPPPALLEALRTARVPLESFEEACAACADCDDTDAADYPKGCVPSPCALSRAYS